MTKSNVLKQFFKKFLGVDTVGNSTTSVMTSTLNAEASTGGSSNIVFISFISDENGTRWKDESYTPIEIQGIINDGMIPVFVNYTYQLGDLYDIYYSTDVEAYENIAYIRFADIAEDGTILGGAT